jgi:glutathione peroxidase
MLAIHQIPFRRNDGAAATLADFRGQVLLVVNVASHCGLTPQYAGLERLFRAFSAEGLTVIGFPANDFNAQEPGSDEEIAQFCSGSFGVTFPLAQKVAVTGPDRHALFGAMTGAQPVAVDPNAGAMRRRLSGFGIAGSEPADVLWNFEKFLISRDGRVVGRFNPDVEPDDPVLLDAIEKELAKSRNSV